MFRFLSKDLTPPQGTYRISEDMVSSLSSFLVFIFFWLVLLFLMLLFIIQQNYFILPLLGLFLIGTLFQKPWTYTRIADLVYLDSNKDIFLFIYKSKGKRIEIKTGDLLALRNVNRYHVELLFLNKRKHRFYPAHLHRNEVLDKLQEIIRENKRRHNVA